MEDFKWFIVAFVALFMLWYANGGAKKVYTDPFLESPQEVR